MWVCSRWRERGEVGARYVPSTLLPVAEGT
jgi:hypothetical protein